MREVLDEPRLKKKALDAYWKADIQNATTLADVFAKGYITAVKELNLTTILNIDHEERTEEEQGVHIGGDDRP